MRIWFDLSNSPHVNMFAAMVRELQRVHEVVVTCRPLANTVDLLELHGIAHSSVGIHYGGRLTSKLLGFPVRVWQLRRFLAKANLDVAVSQSSFHSPVVAKMLGIRCIYMNDNEHALGNVPAFLCADKIMVPEYLGLDRLEKQWANLRKVVQYPGVKEGIYLWELGARLTKSSVDDGSRNSRKVVYIRPEPWTAQYYKGKRYFLDELLLGIKEHAEIVLLPRGKEQALYYQNGRFNGIRIVTGALDIADIAPDCGLFIGAGGTMTREMAVLGVPTISVYQDELLDVDRYLLKVGAFLHRPQLTAEEALEYVRSASHRPPSRELLEKGRVAYEMVKEAILAA